MQTPILEVYEEGIKAQLPSNPPALQDSFVVYVEQFALGMHVVPFEIQPAKDIEHSELFVFFISIQVFFLQLYVTLSKMH